jgi:hypothetical protein
VAEVPAPDAPQAAPDSASSTPYACAEPIYVPQAASDATDPVAADASSPLVGDAPSPSGVRVFLGADPSSELTVLWDTDLGTMPTELQIGLTDAYGTTVEGASFALGEATDDKRVHEVRVCGLSANGTWHYRVGGQGHWSADHRVVTAPAVGSRQRIRFAVAGDTRNTPATWGTIVSAVAAAGVDFLAFTGDFVATGTTMSQWDAWLSYAGEPLGDLPLVVTHGNHEANHQNFYGMVAAPGDEAWYSLDYGNVHLAVFNDTPVTGDLWTSGGSWLESDLAATAQPWKFTLHHKAPYTSSTTDGADENVQRYYVPAMEQYGVQVDFAGHDHRYERSVPMLAEVQTADGEGVTYIVSGGGGAPLYSPTESYWYTAVEQVVNHWVLVTIEDRALSLVAYDTSGNVIDEHAFTISE